jgi:hypothetical protein
VGRHGRFFQLHQRFRALRLIFSGFLDRTGKPVTAYFDSNCGGTIRSVARASEGWRTCTAGGGVTGGHHDHVHFSKQNPYGD